MEFVTNIEQNYVLDVNLVKYKYFCMRMLST